MSPITATMHNGQLILNQPVDWPEGTIVEFQVHQVSTDEQRILADVKSPSDIFESRSHSKKPQIGTQKGSVLSMEQFDDPLEDFQEYMN